MYIIIVLLAIMGLISTDIFVPSLPNIAIAFHQPMNYTQLTISLFLAGFAISQLFYGPISDVIGRKKPLITGVTLFILGSLLCISASSFTTFCLGRIIQGLGVGAGLSLARVILRDRYTETELAVKTAQVAIAVSLTPALAPFIGGFLQQQFGFLSSFYFMLGYGLVLLFLLLFFYSDTIGQTTTSLSLKSVITKYTQLLRHKTFIKYAMVAGIAFSSIILYANVLPFIIQKEFHMSPSQNGLVMLISALGISIASLLSSRMVKHIPPNRLIKLGLTILFISGILLLMSSYFFGTQLIIFISILFFITMSCGFIFPNAIAVCFSEVRSHIGIAGAIYGSIQIFISMLINFVLNTIHHQGINLLGIFYIVIGLCGLMLIFKKQVHIPSENALILE